MQTIGICSGMIRSEILEESHEYVIGMTVKLRGGQVQFVIPTTL